MIRRLEIKGLNNRVDVALAFHADVNIFTGPNGSGKTTLLKLLWYLISGNLERIFPEIPFRFIVLESDSFSLMMARIEPDAVELIWHFAGAEEGSEVVEIGSVEQAFRVLNSRIARTTKRSLFFPSIRRVQEGFPTERLHDSLTEVSTVLSKECHKFVSSISTAEIAALLTEKYAEATERMNVLQKESFLQTLALLSEQSCKIMRYECIRFPDGIVLGKENGGEENGGEENGAVFAENLSAGEKQMLSFLCYNAFSKETAIFIDEPELSLHVDWQGMLLPMFLERATGNQFFVATHSPFIYALYPDKEILLDCNRGYEEGS